MDQSDYKFLIYNTDDENISINTIVKDETIWVSQKAMAQLFGCTVDNISLHLKNVFDDGELLSSSTAEDFSVVQKEGQRSVRRKVTFYNLDAIISVGYTKLEFPHVFRHIVYVLPSMWIYDISV